MIRLVIIICILVLFIVGFSILNIILSVIPPRYVSPITPKDLGFEYEEIWLETEDKVKLNAWFIPNNKSDKLIIICHGYPFDKGNVLGFTDFLHDNYNLLFFDFRAMGKSKGKYTTVGYNEVKDFNAAVDFLKKGGFKKIGALGFSLGAATIIMANNHNIDAIVADSSYANLEKMVEQQYRIFFIFKKPFVIITRILGRMFLGVDIKKVSPQEAIREIKVPVLLIHGEKDEQIPVENSKLIHEANPQTELWIIPNAMHGEAHAINPEEYEKRVLGFLNNI